MQNFDVFFKIHFDSKEISDDELNLYTAEHIKRLAAVPRFSTITASLLAAHNAYFGAIADEATNAAIQKGFTHSMETAKDAFFKTAGRHEGAIRSKFGEKSPEYLRFFPAGLTEYREATMENIDQKLTRLAQAFADLGSRLDPEVVADFTAASVAGAPPRGVIPAFQSARAAQLVAKGANIASKSPSATSRSRSIPSLKPLPKSPNSAVSSRNTSSKTANLPPRQRRRPIRRLEMTSLLSVAW
jgi:hypothetical protein